MRNPDGLNAGDYIGATVKATGTVGATARDAAVEAQTLTAEVVQLNRSMQTLEQERPGTLPVEFIGGWNAWREQYQRWLEAERDRNPLERWIRSDTWNQVQEHRRKFLDYVAAYQRFSGKEFTPPASLPKEREKSFGEQLVAGGMWIVGIGAVAYVLGNAVRRS